MLSDVRSGTLEPLWPMPGAALRESPGAILVVASTELDTTLLDACIVTLRRSGGDGNFVNDNERVINASSCVDRYALAQPGCHH
jgi:hypothetical protein